MKHLTKIAIFTALIIPSVIFAAAKKKCPPAATEAQVKISDLNLPSDFNPRTYVALNKDLQDYIKDNKIPEAKINEWATQHYLTNGFKEKRAYK